MPIRARRSYAWALYTHEGARSTLHLSDNQRIGFTCALELAYAARQRSRQNLRGSPPATRVTLAALAAREGVSETTLRRWIEQARSALFGDASDAAIYKRAQRQRTPRRKGFRRCAEPDCDAHLHADAHGNAKYCRTHSGGAQRTRRHRQRAVS